VRLAGKIDWEFLDGRLGEVYRRGDGHPPLPVRLMAGLLIPEAHAFVVRRGFVRAMGGEPVFPVFLRRGCVPPRTALRSVIAHPLAPAAWRGAIGGADPGEPARRPRDRRLGNQGSGAGGGGYHRAAKAIAHPTDARLIHTAIVTLTDFSRRNGIVLRQSYLRLAKRAAIMVGRYTHAHQFKRANRALKFLRTRLGRLIRDINRKIGPDAALDKRFAPLRSLAIRIHSQNHRQHGPKVYSVHAPEVECIGKGKRERPISADRADNEADAINADRRRDGRNTRQFEEDIAPDGRCDYTGDQEVVLLDQRPDDIR